jgi:hypothetical protein
MNNKYYNHKTLFLLLFIAVMGYCGDALGAPVTVGNLAEFKAAINNPDCEEIILAGDINFLYANINDVIIISRDITLTGNGRAITISYYDTFRTVEKSIFTIESSKFVVKDVNIFRTPGTTATDYIRNAETNYPFLFGFSNSSDLTLENVHIRGLRFQENSTTKNIYGCFAGAYEPPDPIPGKLTLKNVTIIDSSFLRYISGIASSVAAPIFHFPGEGTIENVKISKFHVRSDYNNQILGGGFHFGASADISISGDNTISEIYAPLSVNAGGGVYLESGAKVTMLPDSSLTIDNCTTDYGAGICFNGNTEWNMTSRSSLTIDRCYAKQYGAGIYIADNIKWNMSDDASATISNNIASGIYQDSGTNAMTWNNLKVISNFVQFTSPQLFNKSVFKDTFFYESLGVEFRECEIEVTVSDPFVWAFGSVKIVSSDIRIYGDNKSGLIGIRGVFPRQAELQNVSVNIEDTGRLLNDTGRAGDRYGVSMVVDRSAVILSGDNTLLSSGSAFDNLTLTNRDRKSTRLNSSHSTRSRMPSSA